ncbi:MAG: hypothetical protein ACRDA5_06100 [Clostridium sp.]
MNIFECNARQLILLAALIADQIATEYSLEERDVIATVLAAVVENISMYSVLEGINQEDPNKPDANI